MVFARELTKRFETIHACPLAAAVQWLEADDNHRRGEFVVIVEGCEQDAKPGTAVEAERVLKLLLQELPLRQAASLAAKITGARKNELYELGLRLRGDADSAAHVASKS